MADTQNIPWIKWKHSLTETTESKRGARTLLQPGFCDELAGADMRTPGGLKPIPGLNLQRDLGSSSANGNTYTLNLVAGDLIRNVFPITFHVGTDTILSGFVVRYTIGGITKVVVEYFDGTHWRITVIHTALTGTQITNQMDVVTAGRLVYIFIGGMEPRMFYCSDLTTPVLVSDTGPGEKPTEAILNVDASPSGSLCSMPIEIPAGTYSVCYQLKNTVTGRLSGLSQLATVDVGAFPVVDEASVPAYLFIGIDGIDINKYNQVKIYRSIRIEVAGTVMANTLMFLEKQLDLVQGAPTDCGNVASGSLTTPHRVELTDEQLLLQEVYDNKALFDEDMPKASAAAIYQGTLYTAQTAENTNEPSKVGELRWSSPVNVSPELFPPLNRWVSDESNDVPIRFIKVADALFGLGRNNLFVVMKQGRLVTIQETHQGNGVVGQFAASSYMGEGFIITSTGLMSIDRSGASQAYSAVDKILHEDWVSTRNQVYLTSDPPTGILSMLNPATKEIVCLWTNSRAVSEIHHANFVCAGYGTVPGESIKRTMYITPSGKVMVFDYARSKSKISMLENGGVTTTSTTGTSTGVTIADNGNSFTTTQLRDCYIAVISGASIGEERRVIAAGGSGPWTLVLESAVTLASGDKILVSPVVFSARTWPAGMSEDGGLRDDFRGRTIQSIGAQFFEVSGGLKDDPDVAKYKASVYKGNSGSSSVSAYPLDGSSATVVSVKDGANNWYARMGTTGVQGSVLVPEIRVLACDLDFRLIGLSSMGAIEKADNRT